MWKKVKKFFRKLRCKLKNAEYGKLINAVSVSFAAVMTVRVIERYYGLCELAIMSGASELPSEAIAVTMVTALWAPIGLYYAYQYKCKNSRNKYGIAPDGTPYSETAYKEIVKEVIQQAQEGADEGCG